MKRILIIKNTANSFESFINDRISQISNCEVLSTWSVYSNGRTAKDFYKCFRKCKSISQAEYDKIIVFDSYVIAFFLTILCRKTKVVLFFWNCISSTKRTLKRVMLHCLHAYTFDGNDANYYRLNLASQFHCFNEIDNEKKKIEHDLVFVGANKDRLETLLQLDAFCKENTIKNKFIIVSEEIRIQNEIKNGGIHCSRWMDYLDVIDLTKKSSAILDIVHGGQIGMTMRVMEAIFFDKLLVTNNIEITKQPFYDKKNIFVIGIDNMKELKKFLSSGNAKYSQEIKDDFHITHWIESF